MKPRDWAQIASVLLPFMPMSRKTRIPAAALDKEKVKAWVELLQGGDKHQPVEKPDLHSSRIPATRIGRIYEFASLGLQVGSGILTNRVKQLTGLQSSQSNVFTPRNVERIVKKLSKMRGAALKLGQMLSIQDNDLVDPQVQEIMKRVQNQANYMPLDQLEDVLRREWGSNWEELFDEFDKAPIAAASIGQVHLAVYKGNRVAVKVQYPGVKESIDSDLDNLVMLLSLGELLPKGLYLDNTIRVARGELKMECDYIHEADAMIRFQSLLTSAGLSSFRVPKVYKEISTANILVTEFVEGHTIDKAARYSQTVRDTLGKQLLRLCLHELFVFRFMQTDPNWSNFLFNPKDSTIYLLDFGAAKEFPTSFLDGYIELLKSGAEEDREKAIEKSKELGFLTGYESSV